MSGNDEIVKKDIDAQSHEEFVEGTERDGKGKEEVLGTYNRMLYELQVIDFTLIELNLYLDTHPNDPQALMQYNRGVQARQQLAMQYEHAFGPLMAFGHSFSSYPWQWPAVPWPWQV